MSDESIGPSPRGRTTNARDTFTRTRLAWARDHPGEAFEALPDDAVRPTEVTIRPRYADDTTTTWVSARIEDTVNLADTR